MPKAVWSGAISFGLVTVPVRLFPATEPKDVRFHLYDREGRRIRYRRVVEDDRWQDPAPPPSPRDLAPPSDAGDETDDARAHAVGSPPGAEAADTSNEPFEARSGSEVAWEEVARGVEDELGRVVLLSSEEIERARPERSRTIDIEDFVELRDIDPVHFEKSYYLAPATPDAVRPYVLLHRTLADAGRVGIGRFVLRTRPHLVAIRPTRGVLGLETLYFGDEVREPSAVVPLAQAIEVTDRELELAERLVDTLATEWDPSRYADTYREDLLRMLAEKTPESRPAPEARTAPAAGSAVDDLMRALRESVENAKRQPRPRGKRPRKAG